MSRSGTNSTRLLPPLPVLKQLRAQEFTYKEIGQQFGTTEHAVYRALYRAGLTAGRKRHADDIPWMIEKEHDTGVPLRNLRVKARRDAGKPISEAEERRLNDFLDRLKANNLVVGYDADLPPDPELSLPSRWKSYGGRGGWFVTTRHPNDAPWPSVITLRDSRGRWRTRDEVHPDNGRELPNRILEGHGDY